jgi:hypothetical protein
MAMKSVHCKGLRTASGECGAHHIVIVHNKIAARKRSISVPFRLMIDGKIQSQMNPLATPPLVEFRAVEIQASHDESSRVFEFWTRFRHSVSDA